jgi:predicted RNase H-like nuclease (RuvC/YqgF family)
MVVKEDIKRIVRGPNDLEERIEQLEKQKELLKFHCKKAGARIEELEEDLVKALAGDHRVAESDKIIMKKMEEIEQLKADLTRAKEDHQYDNLVHQKELEDLRKK